ncbi:EH signature domain-containing protein [Maritalea sp.]|uniref:EH signature domain-containing protein n=1 Tax=Maritalea sp. TaxID=2003361 RepID=UPI003EFA2FF4
MTVRAFIPAFSGSIKRVPSNSGAFFKICTEIAGAYQRKSTISVQDIHNLAESYTKRLPQNHWDGATEADVSILLRAACAGRLTPFRKLQKFLLQQAARTSRSNLLSAMCEGYFEGWKEDDPLTVEVSGIMQDRADKLPDHLAHLVGSLPETFDPSAGALKVAMRMAQDDDPFEMLISCGFTDPHAIGFCTKASRHFLTTLPPVRTRADMDRLMRWCRPDGVLGLQGKQMIDVINLLLRPWISNNPAKMDQKYIIDFLMGHFEDPRISGEHIWKDVDPDCRGVLLRWLAGDSIIAFMDIISTVEHKNPETWRMRREFWTRLYDEGTVSEAWVALHPIAVDEAQRRFDLTQDMSLNAYAKQSGKRRDTSLLIMRAGNRIIVEGSHTYRVHIFKEGALQRPELYLETYKDEDITLEDRNPNTWSHDVHGRWREKVREQLK